MINKNNSKKILATFLAASLVYTGISSTLANDLQSKKNELQNIQNQINQTQNQIDTKESELKEANENKNILSNEIKVIEGEKSSLETQINALNLEIQQVLDRIFQIESEIITTNEKIKVKEIEIQQLVERIESNTKLLQQRLVVMYKMGDAQKIEILLNSKDVNDFLSRNTMVTSITEYDQNLIKSLKEDKTELDKLLSELNGQKKVLEINKQNSETERQVLETKKAEQSVLLEQLKEQEAQKYTAMQGLEKTIEDYQAFLSEKLAAQSQLSSKKTGIQSEIARIEAEIIERERAAEEARKAAEAKRLREAEAREQARLQAEREAQNQAARAELEAKKNELQNVDSQIQQNTNTGKLHWPAGTNWVTSPYGWRIDPFGSGQSVFHDGFDIAGPMGTPLYAAESGTVTHAGWGTGYGYYVEITHNAGMKTRYGHMNGVSVSVGQQVARGQYIGPMGSTGWSTGPHVHFEVIVNGKKVNPINYLR